MGDVALVAPVLLGVAQRYPDVHITLVTRPKFAVFFEGMERVTVVKADVDTLYKGVLGLYRLYRFISKNGIDYQAIIDLHDHLRTRIMGVYFGINGFFSKTKPKIIVFDKGRKEKKGLIKQRNLVQLPHTTARYAAAFAEIGLPIELPDAPIFQFLPLKKQTETPAENLRIGIAPFAKHATKEWNFEKINELMGVLLKEYPFAQFFLFGGGKKELEKLNGLCVNYPNNTILVAGKDGLQTEMKVMQTLDVILCMDSSNMHLAALSGVKTVSIWGATHIAAGFSAYGAGHGIVEIPVQKLSCRPCSIFGDKPCARGDNACMQWIETEQVLTELKKVGMF